VLTRRSAGLCVVLLFLSAVLILKYPQKVE
jgi:hypothetical protein